MIHMGLMHHIHVRQLICKILTDNLIDIEITLGSNVGIIIATHY